MDRRGLIAGTASLAAGASASGQDFQAMAVASGVGAGTRQILGAGAPAIGSIAYLSEQGREGFFRCVSGTKPAGDPLDGISFACAANDRHFSRIWDHSNGHPEWFGARPGDGNFDCADAIEACFALSPVTQLGQVDYFVRRTLVLNRSWRTMNGSGTQAADNGQGTRIILQGQAPGIHDHDIMLVGSVRQPGSGSESFVHEIHLANFTLVRDGAVTPHPSGDERRYPTGLRASFVVRATFRDIASLENSIGFYFGGTVYTKVDDCLAQRTRAGSGGGRDLAVGFYLDGSPDYGMAGGNASLYLSRCLVVGQHAAHVQPTGLRADGAFVDSFIDHFESAQIDNGIQIRARGVTRPTQVVDLHLRNCVLDGCAGNAIEIDLGGVQGASIEIADPYIYAAAAGGSHGIILHDGGGLVTVSGGQVHGDFREGSLLLQRIRGVRVQGLKLHEGSRPVAVQASGALQLEPQISNMTRQTANFAITAAGMYRSAVRPIVLGSLGKLAGGVFLDAECNYCSMDGTAVDPGCFGEVTSARKLWIGGMDATRGAGAAAFARRNNSIIGVIR
ncbi:hypothetical protein [Sphingomonas antarctica]|uniref:hypothetical protein n=1 Tax=Sphingomonas antarctica TaxID=2040274 RepID=UPI0039E9A5DC